MGSALGPEEHSINTDLEWSLHGFLEASLNLMLSTNIRPPYLGCLQEYLSHGSRANLLQGRLDISLLNPQRRAVIAGLVISGPIPMPINRLALQHLPPSRLARNQLKESKQISSNIAMRLLRYHIHESIAGFRSDISTDCSEYLNAVLRRGNLEFNLDCQPMGRSQSIIDIIGMPRRGHHKDKSILDVVQFLTQC